MKNMMKSLSVLLLAFLFVGCEMLFQEEEKEVIADVPDVVDTYASNIIDDFMLEFESRAISTSDAASMRGKIVSEIASKGLSDSSDLSKIIPVVASSAQLSLKDIDVTDAEKLVYIASISQVSVSVVGDNVEEGTNPADISDMVVSISSAMIETISESGLPPKLISETTELTITSVVAALDEVDLDENLIKVAVADIAAEASIAVAVNEGVNAEILEATLASIPYTAAVAVESIEGIEIDDTYREEILSETYSSVVSSVEVLQADENVTVVINVTVILVVIQEETTTAVAGNSDYAIVQEAFSDTMTTENIAVVIGDSDVTDPETITALEDYFTAMNESEVIVIDESSFDEAVSAAEEIIFIEEVEANEEAGITLTTAEYEDLGFQLLKASSFDNALAQFQNAIDNGDATPQTKLWWAMLTLGSISTDSNVQDIVNNLGLDNYPDTLDGIFNIGEAMTYDVEQYDTYGDEQEYYSGTRTYFKHIQNQDMFIEATSWTDSSTGEVETSLMSAQMMAIIYNMQLNYPNGLNSAVDSVNNALAKIDEVTAMLLTISDDAAFTYTYEMFNDNEFQEGSWPATVDNTGLVFTPTDITAGKAEVYAIVSALELLRGSFLMVQSVSVSADFDGYWDIFNPVTGTFYTYDEDTEKSNGVSDSFDWSTLSNPLADEFLYARADAATYLAKAKNTFVNSLDYLIKASELLVARDASSVYFVSPANPELPAEAWADVVQYQKVGAIAAVKMITSMEDNTVVYMPNGISSENIGDYTVEDNWPTEGYGVNFGALFSKPLFALDSMFDLTTTGEFVFYTTTDGITYTKATTFDEAATYYISFKDVTFNGAITGFSPLLTNLVGMEIPESGAIYFDISSMGMNVAVGSSLTTAGSTYTVAEVEYLSTGSFFHPLGKMGFGMFFNNTIEEADSETITGDETVTDPVTDPVALEDTVWLMTSTTTIINDEPTVTEVPEGMGYYVFDSTTGICTIYFSLGNPGEYFMNEASYTYQDGFVVLEGQEGSSVVFTSSTAVNLAGSGPDAEDLDGDEDLTELVESIVSMQVSDADPSTFTIVN